MAVRVGSAKGDEYGNASGGRAGDQTGGEVGTQNWYVHSKGWNGMRAKDSAVAEKIAYAMQRACDNDHIGYDQGQRDTLYSAAKKVGFDPGKVTTNVETDCSALVRVCLAYAGVMVGDFYTGDELDTIMATGKFTRIPAAQLTSSAYAKRGDILVTKTKGHTVVVLGDGYNSSSSAKPSTSSSGSAPHTLSDKVQRTATITGCSFLNVREWAGKTYKPVSFSPLPAGTSVGICDSLKADDGSTWYFIKYNGRYGFIAACSSADGHPYTI